MRWRAQTLCSIILSIQHSADTLIITHAYDSVSGTFAETASEATTILIQDYEAVNLVISFRGPNLTPAFQAKEHDDCPNGGVNYSNLLQNFSHKFSTMLSNAGIATQTPAVATPTTETKTQTKASQNRNGRFSEDYYYND